MLRITEEVYRRLLEVKGGLERELGSPVSFSAAISHLIAFYIVKEGKRDGRRKTTKN